LELVQIEKPPPSKSHSKADTPLPPASIPVKLKFALLLFVGFVGLAVIEVSGATVSIVQVNEAGVASVLPVLVIARTWNVWLPSARLL
jgi:hypothetical protein